MYIDINKSNIEVNTILPIENKYFTNNQYKEVISNKYSIHERYLYNLLYSLSLESNLSYELSEVLRSKLYKEYEVICNKLSTIRTQIVRHEGDNGFQLFPFQWDSIEFLHQMPTGILASDMGLGKTLMLLSLCDQNNKILILTNNVGKGSFRNNIERFRSDLQFISPKKFYIPTEPGIATAFTYSILPAKASEGKNTAPLEEFYRDIDSNTIILADEVHQTKNYSSQRTKRFRSLVKKVLDRGGKAIGSTGTPVLSTPHDLWTLLQNLDLAKGLFNSYDQFAREMGGVLKKEWGRFRMEWDPKKISKKAIRLLEPVMIRHTKEEVIEDLPEKIYEYLQIPVDGKANRELLDRLEKDLDTISLADLTGRFFNDIQILSQGKIPTALELIEEIEENGAGPIILFSSYLAPLEPFSALPGWATIIGDTKATDRYDIEQAFQAGKYKGLAMTIGSGAFALTLTRGSKMIFLDRAWSGEINKQAEDRILRIGQKNNCQYFYLLSDHPVEDRITKILEGKKETVERILTNTHGRSNPSITRKEILEKALNII